MDSGGLWELSDPRVFREGADLLRSRTFMASCARRTGFLTITCLLAGSAAEIPQGTHVLLRMVNSLSTRTAKAGDQVYFQTATPIAAGGSILVPQGSYVQGTVSEAKRSGKVTGRA